MAHIALINPRFDVSFWGMEHCMRLLGKKANLPMASLPLLAALTPAEHTVRIWDENVAPLDYEEIARADIVGLTGMIVQRQRMRDILTELKRRNAFTVIGGPWVTVQEDYFDHLADVVFIGEADETWPEFLRHRADGAWKTRYQQQCPTEMARLPAPLFDLVDLSKYMFASVQFSRGCPFVCEFCDIIVTFGRRPRTKTNRQFIAELDALRERGMRVVFIVDDNLIANRAAIKALLRDVITWQRDHHYSIRFFTQASLDLAEQPELLELMVQANIVSVFIGIESPNEDSLRETRKLQNVRQGSSLVERVHRIQRAGIEVWCGMIVGFDHDTTAVFASQQRFLREARIADASVGMLYAIPSTPLHRRLEKEGRLDPEDHAEYGTNIVPRNLARAELRDGYVALMHDLYSPREYFDRMEALFLDRSIDLEKATREHFQHHRGAALRAQLFFAVGFAVVFSRILWHADWPLRLEYCRRLARFARVRHSFDMLFRFCIRCARHFHLYRLTRDMAEGPVRSTFG